MPSSFLPSDTTPTPHHTGQSTTKPPWKFLSAVPSYVGFQSAPVRSSLANAAEFLILMAKAYLHIRDNVASPINVPRCQS